MRKKIVIAAAAIALLFALIGGSIALYISNIPRELIEYKSSEKWGAEEYAHMAAYMNTDAGFTANAMLKALSELESAYTVDSVDTAAALYSASMETSATLSAQNSDRSASCNATVYLGDYFRFHPLEIIEGAYPSIDSTHTDSILIDELAAWQLFGTQRGVTGLEAKIGNDVYTVCGVVSVPQGVYSEVYGEKPRVYINADSAACRAGSSGRSFTSFEAMIPDPITNFAENALTGVIESFDPIIQNIDTRFEGETLKEVYDGQTALITDSRQTNYPYTEKAMLILSLKAADAYAVLRVMFIISLVGITVLFFALFGPCVRFVERMLKKLRF